MAAVDKTAASKTGVKKTAKKKAVGRAVVTKAVKHFATILVPVVTEKTALVGQAGECVVFQVQQKASKTEIKAAVEAVYSVKVASVNTVNVFGKPKRGLRRITHRSNVKKAYVTLQKGQTISVVEGV